MFSTPDAIIEFVGAEALMERLGVGREAIRKAIRNGRLPAKWYDACEQLAGRPLPREHFTFTIKGAAKEPHLD